MKTRPFIRLALVLALFGLSRMADAGDRKLDFASPFNKKGGFPATQQVADLGADKFTPPGITNTIDPEWLKPSKELYRLGPGDSIEIELIGEGGGRSAAVVGPDGKIYYSLLPGVMVWGMSLNETRVTLENGMKKFLRQPPDITVNLRSATSKTAWVMGSVEKPGVYPLSTPLTLLDLITLSGGTLTMPGSPDGICDLKRSFVMRDGNLIGVDFERLLRSGDLSQNIFVKANDLVYLRSAKMQNLYVMGAVSAPNIVLFTDQMTLMAAITSCGGTIPYAYRSHVAIIRGSLVNPVIATVDFDAIAKGKAADVRLEAGDIVYVPYVPWQKLAKFAEGVLRQFVNSVAANEGYNLVIPHAGIVPTISVTPASISGSSGPAVPVGGR